ncbi:unnamed protein product [Owenia fusiformis]|uniref:EF-hand domain-containing protein n=1 Tax=Owenia fusiformis TaxID=6347 RepID=A0A8S4PJV4_OWEFU|nr:unnamed protein product [Owenia fusiformis]
MAKDFKNDSFWLSKMRHQFYMWFDSNRNGVVEKKDFDLKFQELVLETKWVDGSPMWKRANDMKNNLWSNLKSGADRNKNNQISLTQWYNFWEEFAVNYKHGDDIPLWFSEFIDMHFFMVDKNGDGWIDDDEFTAFFHESRYFPHISKDVVKAAYMSITMNGKREFDINIFREMMIGFTVSMDMKSPGNIFGNMLVKQIGCETEFKRTKYWERKIKFEFDTWLDQDKNGIVEKRDFDLHVKHILSLAKWTEGSPMWVRCNDLFGTLWNEIKSLADANKDDKITIDEWLNAFEKICTQLKARTMEIPPWYRDWLNLYFDVLDRLGNSDGWVSIEEFKTYFRTVLKFPDDLTEQCYNDITYDGRIAMDRDFWSTMILQYYLSTDMNSAGNIVATMFLGKDEKQ